MGNLSKATTLLTMRTALVVASLAFIACLAIMCLHNETEALNAESYKVSDESLADETLFAEMQYKRTSTLKNVINLKGYCIAAFDKAVELRLAHSKARGALIDFI